MRHFRTGCQTITWGEDQKDNLAEVLRETAEAECTAGACEQEQLFP